MNLTHDNLWQTFESVFVQNLTVSESWKQLIDSLSNIEPKEYWSSLLSVDVIAEKTEISIWLIELVSKNPLPAPVVALWLGIAELYDTGEEKPFYAFYLQGADNYNEQDIEWTTEPVYDPDNKYIVPDVFAEINGIIKPYEEDYSKLDWILTLAYSTFLFADILRSDEFKDILLKHTKVMHVSLGYDGGDFVNISPIV